MAPSRRWIPRHDRRLLGYRPGPRHHDPSRVVGDDAVAEAGQPVAIKLLARFEVVGHEIGRPAAGVGRSAFDEDQLVAVRAEHRLAHRRVTGFRPGIRRRHDDRTRSVAELESGAARVVEGDHETPFAYDTRPTVMD